MGRMKIEHQLPLLRDWRGDELDLRGFRLKVKETTTGFIVIFPQRANYHWQFVLENDRFTIHTTRSEQGFVTRDTWLAVDLGWVRARLADPAFLNEIEQRLLAIHYRVQAPADLERIGVARLQPLPSEGEVSGTLPEESVDLSALAPVAVTEPWDSGDVGTWVTWDANSQVSGLVRAVAVQQGRVIAFVPWEELVHIFHWMRDELVGPTGHFREPPES